MRSKTLRAVSIVLKGLQLLAGSELTVGPSVTYSALSLSRLAFRNHAPPRLAWQILVVQKADFDVTNRIQKQAKLFGLSLAMSRCCCRGKESPKRPQQ